MKTKVRIKKSPQKKGLYDIFERIQAVYKCSIIILCIPFIFFGNFGLQGLLVGFGITIGIILLPFGIYFSVKRVFKIWEKHQNSRIVFQKAHPPTIEGNSGSQMMNNQNYYNTNKLKKYFSKYLFWKNIGVCFMSFLMLSIFSFIYIILSSKYGIDILNFIMFIGFPSTAVIGFLIIIMNKYFYFQAVKDKIKFNIYSGKPNAYYWSPNGYIDFFRKK